MKKLILILCVTLFVTSCSDNIENLNQNIKDPSEVSGESLFAGAQKELVDQLVTPNVNLNNNRLWAQYWQETTYLDESNYDQVTRSIPDNHWTNMYRDVLNNLKEAAKIIDATDNPLTNDAKANKLAIIEVLTVYTYSNLVETYGDIPYTEALDIENTLPAYDDAATVYEKLLTRLDEAITQLDESNDSFSEAEDLIYAGDVLSWKKFANTLRLRMGMVLADINPGLSQSTVTAALQGGIFTSIADDATYAYAKAAPNNNPVNNELVLSGRHDYVAATTLTTAMNNLEDPRRTAYFAPNINSELGEVSAVSGNTITLASLVSTPQVGNTVFVYDETDNPPLVGTVSAVGSNSIDVNYVGTLPSVGDQLIVADYVGGGIGAKSPYDDYSHANVDMTVADRPGTILSYAEAEFLLAEAAERSYPGVTDPAMHYENAIQASFDKWGVTGFSDYIASPQVDYAQALANSTSTPDWKEVIGTQAWIALYDRSFAAYLSIRRLDYPLLTQPASADTGYPVRYTYPVNEQQLNSVNYSAAASNIGGDAPETQLFWDTEYTFDF